LEFFRQAARAPVGICIISHKTRYPYRGPRHDLHAATLDWLDRHGFFNENEIGLPRENVHLELTMSAKLERIAHVCCTHFLDGLPGLLPDPAFPGGVGRCLLDPGGLHEGREGFVRVTDWRQAPDLLRGSVRNIDTGPTRPRATSKERLSC